MAALLGLTSAAVATDLANTPYSEWGWAFKWAGISFAIGAVWLARRRARASSVDRRPNLKRFVVVLVVRRRGGRDGPATPQRIRFQVGWTLA
ncbi:MAG: hypothetical protein H0V97_02735 [Actinobacteria bacterium]|nr:hypothetical protein [Actinomycetota bacterium]